MDQQDDDRSTERHTYTESAIMTERRLRIANLATALALSLAGIKILRDQPPVEVVPARQE
jgi:hypothetical protein